MAGKTGASGKWPENHGDDALARASAKTYPSGDLATDILCHISCIKAMTHQQFIELCLSIISRGAYQYFL
ncbi:MAG: hypothetical protein M0Q01_05915 [Syntrophales bacterium]|jgi:hypothetical protein|nr:hypothetical protein [Syntrophales bacterium]